MTHVCVVRIFLNATDADMLGLQARFDAFVAQLAAKAALLPAAEVRAKL